MLCDEAIRDRDSMDVFYHHVYEYVKGIRRLILHTTMETYRNRIEDRLQRNGIAYLVYPLGEKKINVFFGDEACIAVIRRFNKQNLFDLSDEEDFILGAMLGYDTAKQCERYLGRKARTEAAMGRGFASHFS